jgi:hypothetical protein
VSVLVAVGLPVVAVNAEERDQWAQWTLRVVTVLVVLAVAVLAAVQSYTHMLDVARGFEHNPARAWRANIFPLSVDGLAAAATLVLVTRRRAGLPDGYGPWAILTVAVGVSTLANVMGADDDAGARFISAWPAVAFPIAVHLLAVQRKASRPAVAEVPPVETPAAAVPAPVWSPSVPLPEPLPIRRVVAQPSTPRAVDEPGGERVALVDQVRRADLAPNALQWIPAVPSVTESGPVEPVAVGESVEVPKREVPSSTGESGKPVRKSPSRVSSSSSPLTDEEQLSAVRQLIVDAAAEGKPAPGHIAVTKALGFSEYHARRLLKLAKETAAEPVTSTAGRGRLAAVAQQSGEPVRQVGGRSVKPVSLSQPEASGSPEGQHSERPASTTPRRSDPVRRAADGGP